jgi:hypothetical protein
MWAQVSKQSYTKVSNITEKNLHNFLFKARINLNTFDIKPKNHKDIDCIKNVRTVTRNQKKPHLKHRIYRDSKEKTS